VEDSYKSGFVTIVGRPNVGKSTLLNSLLGEKISIVTDRPQTTRNRILGVKHLPHGQIIFLDTPGIHWARSGLNVIMVKTSLSTLNEVDLIVYVVEATESPGKREKRVMELLSEVEVPVFLCLNKIDMLEKKLILPRIEEYTGQSSANFEEVIPISALKGDGTDLLIENIFDRLPEGPQYFGEDLITDQPQRFIAAEFIREAVTELTFEEVPHAVAVVVDEFKENPDQSLVRIHATIYVERMYQKGIIIGKNGQMLKQIGQRARHALENILGSRVYLELWVKVEQHWRQDPKSLKKLGYS